MKIPFGKVMRVTLLGLGALLASACQVSDDPDPVATISFSVQSDSVLTASTYQTVVKMQNTAGKEITSRRATYRSLDAAVATVDDAGIVTGVAPGQTTIQASADGRTATMAIRVLPRVSRIVVIPENADVEITDSRVLVATPTTSSGAAVSGRLLRWQTSNPAVAVVNAAGLVTTITLGTAVITVSSELDNVSTQVTIRVVPRGVSTVSVLPVGPHTMRLGLSLQLTATVRDVNGNALTGRVVNWSSSQSSVATVNSTGLVTAVAVGTTIITAESELKQTTVAITVTEVPAKTVSLSPDSVSIAAQASQQLVPVVVDSLNRTLTTLVNHTVIWSSSNPVVASVSSAGVITGLTQGTTRINVTVDNVRSNDVVVSVSEQVATVVLSPSSTPAIRIGSTLQLSATARNNLNQVIPGKVFQWTSSAPTVATVNQNGLVTAVGIGTAVVNATVDGKQAAIVIPVTAIPIASVVLPVADTLIQDDQRQFTPIVTDSTGAVITNLSNRVVTWQSTNIPVASVSVDGIVTASPTSVGTALIIVTVDGVRSNSMLVRVSQLSTIELTPVPFVVKVGQSRAIAVRLLDPIGNELHTSRTITFVKGPIGPGLFNMTAAGVVTGVTVGNAQVTVSVNGIVGITGLLDVRIDP